MLNVEEGQACLLEEGGPGGLSRSVPLLWCLEPTACSLL